MADFESISEALKNTAEKIGKKTVDTVDISKYKINAANVKSKIKHCYEELGKIVYDSKKNGYISDEIIEKNIKEIDNLNRKLSEINSKIARLQKKTSCKKCGEINNKSALYCSKCGNSLKEEQ